MGKLSTEQKMKYLEFLEELGKVDITPLSQETIVELVSFLESKGYPVCPGIKTLYKDDSRTFEIEDWEDYLVDRSKKKKEEIRTHLTDDGWIRGENLILYVYYEYSKSFWDKYSFEFQDEILEMMK